MSKVVVIVDDEEDFCELLARAFQRGNLELELHRAHDGVAGLSVIEKLVPDLVILDIKMPRLNGYEVLNRMRASKQLCRIPVMMLTSLTDGGAKSDDAWAESLDVQAFITKPTEIEAVVLRVEELLGFCDSP